MDWLMLALAVALVLANAFFVAVEFALVKVRPTQLEALADRGSSAAATALAMRRKLDVWLSASQVGITLASLALGWVGEPAFAHLVEPLVLRLVADTEAARAVAHTVSVVIAFAIITFLHIVLGEQVPKTVAIVEAERTSVALAWPMRMFYFLAFPVIWVLNAGTRLALSVFGLRGAGEASHGEALGLDELRLVFSTSAEAGALDQGRAELLERALSMMEKTARQIMVPRSQIQAVDLDRPLAENLQVAFAAAHTWLPVIRISLDRVEGLVNVKELYALQLTGELKSISQVQKPVLFVPEHVTVEQLLGEFRRRNRQIAVVVDEHGGTSGLVTLSDVVAELLGNVAELGRKVDPVKRLPGGRLELPGTAQLDDLEHTLEVEFDVDKSQVTTIAGYLMAKLGRVPSAGDMVMMGELKVNVIKTEGPKVVTVRIEPTVDLGPPPPRASPLPPP